MAEATECEALEILGELKLMTQQLHKEVRHYRTTSRGIGARLAGCQEAMRRIRAAEAEGVLAATAPPPLPAAMCPDITVVPATPETAADTPSAFAKIEQARPKADSLSYSPEPPSQMDQQVKALLAAGTWRAKKDPKGRTYYYKPSDKATRVWCLKKHLAAGGA
eukprot:TRINITY_DN28463_c0_g1_i1.p1 TRINITY_DN28463_c0_g1~~TRINITY_DN28463_c0_g1_i1.p1  ORF type:complete len:164 (+),score=60.86 TRINITY_DN28463_c0_g1_i1:122-613(+)